MSLENASFITQLQATNPTTTDKVKEGDDHIRLLKKVLQLTFPNMGGPMTKTHTDLNSVPGNLTAIIAGLISNLVPKGTIVIFDPSQPIPSGWAICDGHLEVGYGTVPDLRGLFIKGGATLHGTIAGADVATTDSSGAHSHGGETGGHGLTAGENGPHSHTVPEGARYVDTQGTNDGLSSGNQAGNRNDSIRSTDASGSGIPHTHPIGSDGAHSHGVTVNPRHYVALFIIKVIQYTAPV